MICFRHCISFFTAAFGLGAPASPCSGERRPLSRGT
jgi:hypothetical protein